MGKRMFGVILLISFLGLCFAVSGKDNFAQLVDNVLSIPLGAGRAGSSTAVVKVFLGNETSSSGNDTVASSSSETASASGSTDTLVLDRQVGAQAWVASELNAKETSDTSELRRGLMGIIVSLLMCYLVFA